MKNAEQWGDYVSRIGIKELMELQRKWQHGVSFKGRSAAKNA